MTEDPTTPQLKNGNPITKPHLHKQIARSVKTSQSYYNSTWTHFDSCKTVYHSQFIVFSFILEAGRSY